MKPERVAIIGADWPELERYCPNWLGMRAGMERLSIPYVFLSCRPTLDIERLVAYKPDLVVYALKDMIARSDWRQEIRERLPDARIVMWYGDYRDEGTTQINADCSEMDAMFVSNNAQEAYYQHKWKMRKVHFLPLGSEPLKKPKKSKLFEFPFVFIGGQIPEGGFHARATLIERFKLEGGLTLINSWESKMRARIFKEMPAIYSSSKICLDVSHFTNIPGYTSIRYFEIPAFHGFGLTKRFPGCQEFYPEDTRAYFDTFEEAIEKKNYYLAHENERIHLLKKAHELSYNHAYDKRFLKMFSLL